MYYPLQNDIENTRGTIDIFQGYNHTPVAGDGEFYDMRNLTSDHYPLFAPRSPRKVLLELASSDWQTQEITVTSRYVGDITREYCEYETTVFPADDKHKEAVTFSTTDEIGTVFVTITYLDESGKVLRTETMDGPAEFIAQGDVASAKALIRAYPAEGVTLDPDLLDSYVTDIKVLRYNDHIRGMIIKNQQLAYMIGQKLYYGEDVYDFSEDIPGDDDPLQAQQLISYGAYILIFPLGLYFNTIDPSDRGYLGSAFGISNVTITMYPTDLYGNNIGSKITYSKTDPGAAAVGEGNYWIDVEGENVFMYQSTGTTWTPVSTCWMKITVDAPGVDLTQYFSEGDAVFMNTNQEDVNNGSVIQKIDEKSITVIAFPKSSESSQTFGDDPFVIERRIPQLDYVCVYNNRVWGCYYGDSEGGFLNEIYACKQGDPKNWYDYTTLLGAYAVSIGSDGPWTGAITYQGYPTFFKENAIYRVFGTIPSNFQVNTLDARGVQIGSERSLAICGEYLLYKSMADICVFDGSNPASISAALGSEVYTQAVAGAAMNKYYVSMYDSKGVPQLLVYDMSRNVWMKEDELRIEEFDYTNSGQLYGHSGLAVYGFGIATDTLSHEAKRAEKYVSWWAETGDMGYEYPDHKYVQKITLRAKIPFRSEIRVSISHDGEKFEDVCVLRGTDKVQTQSMDIRPERCDHYRLRLEGHGDVRIYSLTRTLDTGSEEG